MRVIKEKYGVGSGGVFPKRSKLPYGVSVWRGIARVEELFRTLTKVQVGNGMNTSLWSDSWCTDYPLATLLPNLFKISACKSAIVADFFNMADPVPYLWPAGMDLQAGSEVAGQHQTLVGMLQGVSLLDREDRMTWAGGSNIFTVSECYSQLLQLRRNFFDPGAFTFRWSSIWAIQIPSKVCFLAWVLVRERALTHEGL